MRIHFLVFYISVCWRTCGSWNVRHHHYFVMCQHSAHSVCLPWEENRLDFVTCIVPIMRKVCETVFLCTVHVCVRTPILVPFGGSSSSSWIIYESHALFNISMSPRKQDEGRGRVSSSGIQAGNCLTQQSAVVMTPVAWLSTPKQLTPISPSPCGALPDCHNIYSMLPSICLLVFQLTSTLKLGWIIIRSWTAEIHLNEFNQTYFPSLPREVALHKILRIFMDWIFNTLYTSLYLKQVNLQICQCSKTKYTVKKVAAIIFLRTINLDV